MGISWAGGRTLMRYDDTQFFELEEDPEKFERWVAEANQKAKDDPAAAGLVEAMYGESDRRRAFERFRRSDDFRQLDRLLRLWCDLGSSAICEIGAGPGMLAWALTQNGFKQVSILEPNGLQITGTGFLQSLNTGGGIRIWNDLARWHADSGRYDLILTRNCVHHFQNIALTAAGIRKKMTPKGIWVMVREWYADDARELYRQLWDHPLCQTELLYEWPHPASHYVECMELAGFRLNAVVPADYADGCLGAYLPEDRPLKNGGFTEKIYRTLQRNPRRTKLLYRAELFANRYLGRRWRRYTRPQVMVFERVEL